MKPQQKRAGTEAFQFETVHKIVTRRTTLRNSEHQDLMLQVDDLQRDCCEYETAVYILAQGIVRQIDEMIDFLEHLAMVKDGVSDVSNHLGVDGWDAYDASRELEDHAAALEDLHSQQREIARTLILLVRELLDIKD